MQQFTGFILIALTAVWSGGALRLHAEPPEDQRQAAEAVAQHGIINVKQPPFNAVETANSAWCFSELNALPATRLERHRRLTEVDR